MPALDLDLDEVTATFQTNVVAVMRVVQAFSPLLIASKGTIVQIGSVTMVTPLAFSSVYNASKAALWAYSFVSPPQLLQTTSVDCLFIGRHNIPGK
jgi:1-acylglycerone phosphate reductase